MIRRFLPLLVLPAAFLIACGGGGSKSNTATPAPGQTTVAGTPGGPSDTPAPTPPDPFQSLQAYRYTLAVSSESEQLTVAGTVKAPDSNQLDISLEGQLALSAIILGDKAWLNDASTNEWAPVDVAEAEANIQGLLPRDFWGVLPLDELSGAGKDLGEEDVNGVPTHHYQITNANQQLLSDLAVLFGGANGEPPQAFSMDLWRADDGGWPAKATIDVTFAEGAPITIAHIDWSTSDVNSSSVSITPPA
jgi:hypothetical protein